MKKTIIFLISLIMVFIMSGCDISTAQYDNNDDYTTQNETEENEELDEKFDEELDEEWILKYYVDEFNQPTNEWYVTSKYLFTGVFSNSATTNSLLYANIMVDADGTSIVLYEYGKNQVKDYSETTYNILVRDSYGTDYKFYGVMYSGGDRIYIETGYHDYSQPNKFIELLKNGDLQIVIYDKKYAMSKYSFTVESSNFSELIQ